MMATEDARYRQSTQFRLWSFSPSQLADLRSKTNSLAKASISARLSVSASPSPGAETSSANTPNPAENTAPAAREDGGGGGSSSSGNTPAQQPQQQQQQPPPQQDGGGGSSAGGLPEFLTPAEESQLLKMYTVELLRAAEFCELPTDIRATAAVFFRRFYVTNSIMTYPPTEMLKTAMFFGSKAEGFYTRLARFADNFPNTRPEEILAGEFLLCQGIRFAFDVRHPFRALEGIVMELRRYGDVDHARLAAAHSRARDILKFSPLVTDAYFHYTPSQIMLAALALADQSIFDRVMRETFPAHHPPLPPAAAAVVDESGSSTPAETAQQQPQQSLPVRKKATRRENISGAEVRDKVLATIEACKEMLSAEPPERMTNFWGKPEANKIVRPLVKKLKKCRDPDRWDLVALQNARRQQAMNNTASSSSRHKGKGGGGGGGTVDDDGAVFGGRSLAGDEQQQHAKKRKVSDDDPFGPPV